RLAASARAREAFSTLCHPGYGLPNFWSAAVGGNFVGSRSCAKKMMFELGNRIPRITWRRVGASGLYDTALAGAAPRAGACAAGLAPGAADLAGVCAAPTMVKNSNANMTLTIRMTCPP